jgi:FlaA1/EpsC-like NDP-sugar epimerase
MLVARRKLLRGLVAASDALTIAAAFVGSYVLLRHLFGRHFVSFNEYRWLLTIIIPIWLSCLWVFGLYASASYAMPRWLIAQVMQAHFIASLLFLSAMYLTKSVAVSRLLLQTFLGMGFTTLIIQKFALKSTIEYLRSRDFATRRRVLLVGTSDRALSYTDFVRARTSTNSEIVGFLHLGDPPHRDVEFKRN